MKMIKKMTKRLLGLISATVFLTACEGSRQRRIIDAYGNAYEEYEKTGDPTMLIVMIIAGVILLGVALWKMFKNN